MFSSRQMRSTLETRLNRQWFLPGRKHPMLLAEESYKPLAPPPISVLSVDWSDPKHLGYLNNFYIQYITGC